MAKKAAQRRKRPKTIAKELRAIAGRFRKDDYDLRLLDAAGQCIVEAVRYGAFDGIKYERLMCLIQRHLLIAKDPEITHAGAIFEARRDIFWAVVHWLAWKQAVLLPTDEGEQFVSGCLLVADVLAA